MNLETLRTKLLTLARAEAPSDAVPYAFEKRVMARLSVAPQADACTLWARLLWRAAAPCVAMTLFLAIWALVTAQPLTASTDSLAKDLETAVFAPLAQLEETW